MAAQHAPPASDLAHWLTADEFADLGARIQALPDDLELADPDDLDELRRRYGLARADLWPERRGRLRIALGAVIRARRRHGLSARR